jgi:DNA-binding LacI/PurR family transcriptional regulator
VSPRPSLAQIAARARVSVMTVSRAMRRQPGVSPEVAKRIMRLAETMAYRPNPFVQALMTQVRTGKAGAGPRAIALVVPQFDDAAWGGQDWIRRGIHGASERAQQKGFTLEVVLWRRSQISDQRLDQILKARGIHGLVIAPLQQPGLEIGLDWNHYASGAIGGSLRSPRLHRVRNNAYLSIQLAIEKLREGGCQRVGLALSDFSAARVGDMWQAGFLIATRDYPDRKRRLLLHQTTDLHRTTFLRWIREARPDGLVMQDNRCFTWLREAGLRVPEQIAIAHLNRSSDEKRVAGIDQLFDAIGAATVDLVVEQCLLGEFGVPAQPKDVLLEGVWVPGATVWAAAVR